MSPLVSDACYLAGAFIVLTQIMLFGVGRLIARDRDERPADEV